MSNHPQSGGIYFVVPFPHGWEVRAFPFSHYPDVGHAQIWELAVAPQLSLQWARHLHSAEVLDQKSRVIGLLARQLADLYDAVPRGRAQTPENSRSRCVVYHGDDLSPDMGITRRQIEKLLYLPADTRWMIDSHETQNPDSTQQLKQILGIQP
jgi:hypothetical protein